uniref:RNA-directed DNA polymerase, eukaryota, reverse transcriptase zinc-binding domain protein n=1 Tax=Tanacetum cinerariifolium TaxID=118510 RepID=A0A699I2I2_TANCI|nr:RNA-directed DNA polymerase, eukaryota, reverse transcriptase zinc-binding domain protein [Tanacetum cinerariifolium]
MEAKVELGIEKINEDNMEIGENIRVCESVCKSQTDNNDSLMEDDCGTRFGMNQLNQKGSRKWELSACGYFVGYRMSIQELRTEPKTLPLWNKLMNPPLEAWSTKGLSALASRIGTPLIMDAMTTSMCNQGIGRLGYTTMLVEVNADKVLPSHIDVMYRNSDNDEKFMKKVRVEYDWKPPMCSQCKVFGHADSRCPQMVNKNEQKKNMMKDNEEVLSTQHKFYCTFIYAANKGRDRRELWKELALSKRISRSSERIIMGDVNVSLNLEDHSEGMSNFTQDMIDFQECINEIEMEDINSFGLHFTWIKSLLNPSSSILKKTDRVMGNNAFLSKYSTANALFLPYGIFDHSPAILKVPQAMKKKYKSFRIANYVIDKLEFKDMVKEKWNLEIQGHHMYKLLKKFKSLKPHLNKLN